MKKTKNEKEKSKYLRLRLPPEYYFCYKRNRVFKNKKKKPRKEKYENFEDEK